MLPLVMVQIPLLSKRTLARHAAPVDAGTYHHNIVDHAEATFAVDPFSFTTDQVAIRQHSRLVHMDAAAMELPRDWYCFGPEEVPAGPIDYLIRSVAEDVHNGVGCIQNSSLIGEVCELAMSGG